MKISNADIEVVERTIRLGMEGFIQIYLQERYVPIYIYIRWAEVAKEWGQTKILTLLHDNQANAKLDQFNKMPIKRYLKQENKKGIKNEIL